MKKELLIIATTLLLLITFSACEKSDIEPEVNNPAIGFDFATTKTLSLTVKVNDTFNSAYFYKVDVFDQLPFTADTLVNKLSGGIAKQNMDFSAGLVVPQHLKMLFISQTDPLGRRTVRAMNIDEKSKSITCDFKANAVNATLAPSASRIMKQSVAMPPRATDYQLPGTYTTLSNSSVILAAGNYFVPSGTTNNSINFGYTEGTALYVAGTVSFDKKSEFYMARNTKLIVLPGGKVTFNISDSFEQTGIVVAVHAQGELILNKVSALGSSSVLINDGTISMVDDFEIRSESVFTNNNVINAKNFQQTNNSTFNNYGTVNLSDLLIMNSNTLFENNGTLNVTKSIRTNNITSVIRNNNLITTAYFDMKNGGGTLLNNCKVIAEDMAFDMASITCATGTIISCQDLHVNMTTINLHGNAILKTSDKSESASIAVTGGVTFNYGVIINGIDVNNEKPLLDVWKLNKRNSWQVLTLNANMEFALAANQTPGSDYFKGISNGVSFVEKPTVSIPATTCNNGGVNADTGNKVPSNPTFPMEIDESNSYTFAMEDLWPNLGDYDMNDFVFSIKNIKKTINEENKVLKLQFDVLPRAAGSTKKLAAAVQFDNLQSSNISVSSTDSKAKVETDILIANIRLFDDVHSLFDKSNPVIVNTYEKIQAIQTKSYTITVEFKSPVSNSDVIVSALNFYMIVGETNTSNRKEIHLAGYKPTAKVLRATNNYKDSNNMVWAIMLPTAEFKYPTEKTHIYKAYSLFNSWAASGGRVDADWYLKPNNTGGLIYTKY